MCLHHSAHIQQWPQDRPNLCITTHPPASKTYKYIIDLFLWVVAWSCKCVSNSLKPCHGMENRCHRHHHMQTKCHQPSFSNSAMSFHETTWRVAGPRRRLYLERPDLLTFHCQWFLVSLSLIPSLFLSLWHSGKHPQITTIIYICVALSKLILIVPQYSTFTQPEQAREDSPAITRINNTSMSNCSVISLLPSFVGFLAGLLFLQCPEGHGLINIQPPQAGWL